MTQWHTSKQTKKIRTRGGTCVHPIFRSVHYWFSFLSSRRSCHSLYKLCIYASRLQIYTYTFSRPTIWYSRPRITHAIFIFIFLSISIQPISRSVDQKEVTARDEHSRVVPSDRWTGLRSWTTARIRQKIGLRYGERNLCRWLPNAGGPYQFMRTYCNTRAPC